MSDGPINTQDYGQCKNVPESERREWQMDERKCKEWFKSIGNCARLAFVSQLTNGYCKSCFTDDPHCQCENDE